MKLTAVDPRTGSAIRTHEATAPAEVPYLTAAAVDPRMADTARRAAALRGIAAALDQEGDEVLACFEAETGLPRPRAEAELARTCGQLEAFAAAVEAGRHLEPIIDRADPDATPAPRPDLRRMLVPLGPVAVFRASNVPLAFGVGRVVFDGFPTGVAVTWAMHHGGPYPATTAPGETSVGMTAARRFMRPVCWQDAPQDILPAPLRDANPDGIWRRVDGRFTRASTEGPVG